MKKCTKCGAEKDILDFSISKSSRDGMVHACKECDNDSSREYKRSKHGLVSVMYSSQKRCAKKRGHNPPTYTKDELRSWLYSQDKFHKIHEYWVNSDYETKNTPSVDRINDNKSYTFDNIQLVTWYENDIKGKKNSSKQVSQYSKDGNFIASYVSINEASRKTGVAQSNISVYCRNKTKTASGFIWKYKYN